MFKNCVFKPSVDTVKWWKKAGIRAVKTMAQKHLKRLLLRQGISSESIAM